MSRPRSLSRKWHFLPSLFFLFLSSLSGCPVKPEYNRAITVLIDVSGSYKNYIPKAFADSKRIVRSLQRNDIFYLGIINSRSFNDDNIKIMETLPGSFSKLNARKIRILKTIDSLAVHISLSGYTDIQGAIILMAATMQSIQAREKKVFLFTDLKETKKVTGKYDLSNLQLFVLNIPTGQNPAEFQKRISIWNRLLKNHGVPHCQFLSPAETDVALQNLVR